jgi:AraC family transcriptional regulator
VRLSEGFMTVSRPRLTPPPDAAAPADGGVPWSRRVATVTTLLKSTSTPDGSIDFALLHVSGGLIEAPPSPDHRVYLHVGAPVPTVCGGYGPPRRRLAERGDVDIIAAGAGGFWIDEAPALSLMMAIAPRLLERVGRETGRRLTILDPKGPMRDAALEPIGWALKAELDEGEPGGRLYTDGLALALSARLLMVFGEEMKRQGRPAALSRRRMARVIDYIEAHLDQNLSLDQVAAVACLSPSHFKAAFRQTAGMPVHQYVVRRRVERARRLLAEGRVPIAQVALEVGFAHPSHLARWTRRLLGVAPKALAE